MTRKTRQIRTKLVAVAFGLGVLAFTLRPGTREADPILASHAFPALPSAPLPALAPPATPARAPATLPTRATGASLQTAARPLVRDPLAQAELVSLERRSLPNHRRQLLRVLRLPHGSLVRVEETSNADDSDTPAGPPAIMAADRVLVTTTAALGPAEFQAFVAAEGGSIRRAIPEDHYYVVGFPGEETGALDRMLAAMRKHPGVAHAGPDYQLNH